MEEVFSLEEPLGCADFAAMYIAFLHIWASTILVVGVLMINCLLVSCALFVLTYSCHDVTDSSYDTAIKSIGLAKYD